MRLRPAMTFTLAAGLAVAACQAAPTAPAAGRGAAPARFAMAPLSVRTATVRIDQTMLQTWLQPDGRKLLTGGETPVVRTRLRAIGPGIAVAEEAEQAHSAAAGTSTPPAGLTLAVTPGLNRVFTLEGLDENGQVVKVLRTLGGVAAGQTSTLTINAGTDAAARVLEDLLTPELRAGTDTTGLVDALATADLTADLEAFVLAATGYQAATNVYTKPVAPIHFRDRVLADALLTSGRSLLTAAPGESFQNQARASLQLSVLDHGDPAGGATLTLYTPGEPQETTSVFGTAGFLDVPPGRWVVKATRNGKTAWGVVRTRDRETTETFSIDLDAQGVGPTPTPPPGELGETLYPPLTTPLASATPFPTPASLPYAVTFAGRVPTRNTYNALSPRSERELSKIDFNSANEQFILQYGVAYKVLGGHTYQVIAKPGKAPFPDINLVAMGVAPDGTVYVANADGQIYSCPTTGAPTELATIAGTTDLTVHPDGTYLYARILDGVKKIDLATSLVTDRGSVPGKGPLVCDAGGVIFTYSDTDKKLYKLPVTEPYSTEFLAGSGSIGVTDGAAASASFMHPMGLDLHAVNGTLYVADAGAHRIRSVDVATGQVGTVAGGAVGHVDVPTATAGALISEARFNRPTSLALRSGIGSNVQMLVADAGNERLRVLSPTNLTLTTSAAFGQFGLLPGQGPGALFGKLHGLAMTSNGLVAADDTNNVLWLVEPSRNASPLIGNGLAYDTSLVGVAGSLLVDQARVASAATTATLLLQRNQGSTRAFAELAGLTPEFILGDYAFDGDTAYGIDASSTTFSIVQLGLPATVTPVRANLEGANANYLKVRSGKAYVAYGGGIPKIEEITLTGDLVRRTLSDAGVHDFCVDPQNGHLYAIADTRCEILDINPAANPPTTTVLIGQAGSYGVIDGPAASARFSDLRAIVAATEGTAHYLYVTDGHVVRRIQRP